MQLRKHSITSLLAAPVLALAVLGSGVLTASGASAAATSHRSGPPTLHICRSAHTPGTFKFSMNGRRAVSTAKQCISLRGRTGRNTVREVQAPVAYRTLSSISVAPRSYSRGTSLVKATATVQLPARAKATVSFSNARVVTTGSGWVEVCKYATTDAGGAFVTGSFPFTIKAGSTTVNSSVAVGSCTLPISVPAGTVTITEGAASPYYLASVTAAPAVALGSVSLGTQTASVTVGSNASVTANFFNDTQLNNIKVCKILANNQGSLAGSTFSFAVGWTFTPPAATGGAAMSGSGTASVVAVASPGGACSVFATALPVGTAVTVSENPFPNVSVTGVAIVPPGQNAGSTSSTASFTVSPASMGYTDAIFTNDPLGWIEVCKNAADPSTATQTFQFSVNGGPSFPVHAGQCSVPMAVPAGTATVNETQLPNFYLQDVSTAGPTDPTGSRLLSSPTANPASVSVPYGGIGNETVVTFTDAVDQSAFKICKQETSADANLSGATFHFAYSYSYYGAKYWGIVNLTIGPSTAANPTGEVCSGMIGTIPAVDPWGNPIAVKVSELPTSIPGVEVTDIAYAGNGAVDWMPSLPDPISGNVGCVPVIFDAGAGINVVTYTNGRTPPPQAS